MGNHLIWGAPDWMLPAAILVATALGLLIWSYWTRRSSLGVRLLAAVLKLTAVVALGLCLVEPLFSGTRPRPGANLFLILTDNSRSLQLRDQGRQSTRAEEVRLQLQAESPWQTRLSQDFDVRRYLFDTRLKPVAEFNGLAFDGTASSLGTALETLGKRFHGRPQAGILLWSDGNGTDLTELDVDELDLPPVFPVLIGGEQPARDVRITRVSVSQTNFEASPVTIMCEVECRGYRGQTIVMQLLDADDQPLQERKLLHRDEGTPVVHHFLLRPEQRGVSFYRVRAFAEGEEAQFQEPDRSREATLVNNTRWVTVNRKGGPFRVLYVSGRPTWDFKFLRRAVQEDPELHLIGMLRIAKKEPKFTFRGHQDETTNSLYRGFGNKADEEAEQYDQPVLLRLGTEDSEELRDGFPKAADTLFRYDAVVLDDIEAAFFTQDQMSQLQEFVSQRGGGFLMLGGREAFASGKYARTPIGELLPVYAEPFPEEPKDAQFNLKLTRDGWLQPWVRLRANEDDEKKRLAAMPGFRILNRTGAIKPGATVLSHVETVDGDQFPALVVHRFGKGRAAAMLLGDLWRWNLRRENAERSDLEQFWRQTVRWLVADVPRRVEAEVRPSPRDPGRVEINTSVRDVLFQPLDNAAVALEIETPDSQTIQLTAEPHDTEAGVYTARFAPRRPGPYRARIAATADDASTVGECQVGWAFEPALEEFESLKTNRDWLETLAQKTGGETVASGELATFVRQLPNRKMPITEPWIYPLWHQWSVLAVAIACLVGEWGLRRRYGLP